MEKWHIFEGPTWGFFVERINGNNFASEKPIYCSKEKTRTNSMNTEIF